MRLSDLKKGLSDRAKVEQWLDHILEFDPACRNEILEACRNDPEARRFYVAKFEDCGLPGSHA